MHHRRPPRLLALLLALAAAGCDRQDGVTELHVHEHGPVASSTAILPTRVQYTEPITVQARIGRDGGVLEMPLPTGTGIAYRLTVPRNALEGDALVTLTAGPGSTLVMDLTVHPVAADGSIGEPRSTDFAVPLLLEIAPAYAVLPSGKAPVFLCLRPQGRVEQYPASEAPGKIIRASLEHSSRWALASL
jgi:hypothetical protein